MKFVKWRKKIREADGTSELRDIWLKLRPIIARGTIRPGHSLLLKEMHDLRFYEMEQAEDMWRAAADPVPPPLPSQPMEWGPPGPSTEKW